MRGKVVLVPFPFDDLPSTKVRPAICLTEPIGPHRHVILAFISSQTPGDLVPTDVTFDPANENFRATGLRVRSVLRLHRMVTLTATLIQRELGHLRDSWLDEVNRKLALLFSMKAPH